MLILVVFELCLTRSYQTDCIYILINKQPRLLFGRFKYLLQEKTDNQSGSEDLKSSKSSLKAVWKIFIDILTGQENFVSRSANIVQVLGSVTVILHDFISTVILRLCFSRLYAALIKKESFRGRTPPRRRCSFLEIRRIYPALPVNPVSWIR
jgi:hypothetical protein